MKRLQSITFLLSALTGLSVVLLVSVFSLSAKDAYDGRQSAAKLVADISALTHLLRAEELVLITQGRVGNVVEAEKPVEPHRLAEINRLLTELDTALHSGIGAPGNSSELAKNAKSLWQNYASTLAMWDRALKSRGSGDPAARTGLVREAMLARRDLSASIQERSNILSRNLTERDALIAEMMKIRSIAMKMREDTGAGRRAVIEMIAAGTFPSSQRLSQIAESDGRVSSPWNVVMADFHLPVVPEEMRTAITRANQGYFGDYRRLRQSIVDQLAAGKPPSLTQTEWLLRTDPMMSTVTRVASTALDISFAHVSRQLTAAEERLYLALGLMVLSISLAVLTTIVVITRIIRPLHVMAETMEIVAHGELNHIIPFKDRPDEIGRFARALKTFRDTAREKQMIEAELLQNQIAKESAEASNRVKSEFLANMSHELRTPLNAVIGFSDIMRQKLFGPLGNQYHEYAVLIHESGQLLLNLVSDILDIAKIEAGKFTLDFQPVDLRQEIESCLRLVKRRAADAGVTLHRDLADTPAEFVADRRAVKQILLNLLSNAVKFTNTGGQVDIVTRLQDQHVQITVRDNGIGIPQSALTRIGHAFEQASNDPTRSREGTGLGLALVRALCEQHGGNLHIHSTEHVGTTVVVTLPLNQTAKLAA